MALYSVNAESLELGSQRYHYQKAKSALAQGQLEDYQTHFLLMGDYPLKQYLEYSRIRKNLVKLPFSDIDSFLGDYEGSFLAARLRANLLRYLASRKKWNDLVNYYEPKLANTSMKCRYHYARLYAKDRSTDEASKHAALSGTADLWNVGRSQPKACDLLFSQWRKDGHLTEELLWSRFHKAMESRNHGLAKYLASQLTSKQKYAQLYFKVQRKPALTTQQSLFEPGIPEVQDIISYGIKRLARKKPLDAIYHWELYEAREIFPREIILNTKLFMVKRLIRTDHAAEAQGLMRYSNVLRKGQLLEEIAREALEDLEWHQLVDAISMMDMATRTSERWLYWAARAQDELKQPIEGYLDSRTIYQSLSQNRSFYGFMSSDKIQQGYSLRDYSLSADPITLAQVRELPGIRRAHELWLMGNETEARAEWGHTAQKMNTQQLHSVGELSREWGWYYTGIQAMISGNLWNQLTIRFPLAYKDQIFAIADDTEVEPTLIYAIARQESAFQQNAKSSVGAMGLMQLMPQTAKFTARRSGIKHKNTYELLDAEHNMRLGSHYLGYLLKKYDGNRILTAAAYNAGPRRVKQWRSAEGKERPVDVWIETIPFRETRGYVQNILCFSVIYSYRLGYESNFLSSEEAKQAL